VNTKSRRRPYSARPKKIGILGCENISRESVYSLGLSGAVDEIILVGSGNDRLREDVIGITDSRPLAHPFRILVGNYSELVKADIVIVAVGKSGTVGSADDWLATNTMLVRTAVAYLRTASFRGIALVTTNPVDEMTQVAQEASGLPIERVIGIGGVSPWFKGELVAERKLEAATWCSAHGSGGQLMDSCQPDCPYFEDILNEFREDKGAVIEETVSTASSMATCVMRVCEAILRDERSVLTVSTKPMGEYGIWGVYMTLPCVISSRGIERLVEFKVPDKVRQLMLDHARELARSNRELAFNSTLICPQRGTTARPENKS
jgi:L-lactate dehydrogenase